MISIKSLMLSIKVFFFPTVEYESNGGTKSFVERVFGGELTSTVMCMECKTVSVVTEMFLDLSLPVADEVKDRNEELLR